MSVRMRMIEKLSHPKDGAGFIAEEAQEIADKLIKSGHVNEFDYKAQIKRMAAARGNVPEESVRRDIYRDPSLFFAPLPKLKKEAEAKIPSEWPARQHKITDGLKTSFYGADTTRLAQDIAKARSSTGIPQPVKEPAPEETKTSGFIKHSRARLLASSGLTPNRGFW